MWKKNIEWGTFAEQRKVSFYTFFFIFMLIYLYMKLHRLQFACEGTAERSQLRPMQECIILPLRKIYKY